MDDSLFTSWCFFPISEGPRVVAGVLCPQRPKKTGEQIEKYNKKLDHQRLVMIRSTYIQLFRVQLRKMV